MVFVLYKLNVVAIFSFLHKFIKILYNSEELYSEKFCKAFEIERIKLDVTLGELLSRL